MGLKNSKWFQLTEESQFSRLPEHHFSGAVVPKGGKKGLNTERSGGKSGKHSAMSLKCNQEQLLGNNWRLSLKASVRWRSEALTAQERALYLISKAVGSHLRSWAEKWWDGDSFDTGGPEISGLCGKRQWGPHEPHVGKDNLSSWKPRHAVFCRHPKNGF